MCEDVCVRLKLSPNRISSYLDAAAAYLSGKEDLHDMRRALHAAVESREAKVSHSHNFKGTLQ